MTSPRRSRMTPRQKKHVRDLYRLARIVARFCGEDWGTAVRNAAAQLNAEYQGKEPPTPEEYTPYDY